MSDKLERNIWIFPLLGSVLVFIAFLSPAAYLDERITGTSQNYMYIWMWGLISAYFSGYIPAISFSTNLLILIPSIAISVLVFISFFRVFKSSYRVWKGEKSLMDVKGKWKFMSIILIISTIGWIVWIEIAMFISSGFQIGFWPGMAPGFGIIGIFLGVGFIIIGLLLIDINNKRARLKVNEVPKPIEGAEEIPKEQSVRPKKTDTIWLGFQLSKNLGIILAIISIIGIILGIIGTYTGVYNLLLDVGFNGSILYPHMAFSYSVFFVLMGLLLVFCIYTLNVCKRFQTK